MNSKNILLFLLGFAGAYLIFRNKNTNTSSTTNDNTSTNTSQSGGHIITHPSDIETVSNDSLNIPAPDINIILPKP
jgi:hypothetical protein